MVKILVCNGKFAISHLNNRTRFVDDYADRIEDTEFVEFPLSVVSGLRAFAYDSYSGALILFHERSGRYVLVHNAPLDLCVEPGRESRVTIAFVDHSGYLCDFIVSDPGKVAFYPHRYRTWALLEEV